MSVVKKYQSCIVLAFFLILFPFQNLPADEQQSPEPTGIQKKNDIPLAIKGTNVTIVPAKGESGKTEGENKGKTTVTGEQPHLSIDMPEFDAGDVWEGEDIVHPFIVKNTGKALLEIKNVKAG